MSADLAQLFELYYAPLVRMLYRRTGDRDRAEDLAQETFARAVAAPPNNPRPWLFAVALNLVREDGRRSATRGRRLELLRAEHEEATSGPDAELERREDGAKVRAALAVLNERDR
jgi:RNA polymerase sigma-70 factor (ECF subfamily)